MLGIRCVGFRIQHFFRNLKSDGYLKSDRVGFEICFGPALKLFNHCGCYSRSKVE